MLFGSLVPFKYFQNPHLFARRISVKVYVSMFGSMAMISTILRTIFLFNLYCSSSMFTRGMLASVGWYCTVPNFSIILGPASLGRFSSRIAGRSMMKMNVETPRKSISTVGVGFGVILTF